MNPDLLAAVMGRVQQKRKAVDPRTWDNAGAGKPNRGFMAGNGGVGQNPPSFMGVPGLTPPPQITPPPSFMGVPDLTPPPQIAPRSSGGSRMDLISQERANTSGRGTKLPPGLIKQFLAGRNPQAWQELWRRMYEERQGAGPDHDWLRSQLIRKSIGRRPMQQSGKVPRANGKSQAIRGY